ncbi:EutN/CcmL family microcompartment protein [Kluyvera genomosp. 1]|uniref:EutN/CcmL family microcompartment protein n=1 Tax=Kluyvera genomosp. 1 TaxID=2774053 RepID=UPI00068FCACC|nr:EutN/CcmL family microcompartment protein [Kluyvera genomosp. 1]
MILAKVVGHVVATQKCDELRGSNLLLICKLDDEQQPMKNQTWVAVDSVGAGMHDIVLAEEYLALNKDRYRAMSVVAIVENVFRDA